MSDDFVTVLRQNHALEHATIALLVSKLGLHQKFVGQSTAAGFYIYGDVPTEAKTKSAQTTILLMRITASSSMMGQAGHQRPCIP